MSATTETAGAAVGSASPGRILVASLAGTTIEFFDFYIYATAAVLVFPRLFFPSADPATAALASLATFGIAFLARPVGSVLFGHLGDRIGRKASLVGSLLTMGCATVLIGLLPTYAAIGFAAPLALALCRFAQGLGLGGEWGGAVLLAVENAPPSRRAMYGMFPQLGAPIGFFLCGSVFLALSHGLSDAQFLRWGWRLPFLASAVLVLVGLFVRLALVETPVFARALARGECVRVPALSVLREHPGTVVSGILVCLTAFVLFYLVTVFALSWGTRALGFGRQEFLVIQLACTPLLAAALPVSAWFARRSRRRAMLWANALILLFGLVLGPLFGAGLGGAVAAIAIGMTLMGLTYGPLGTLVSELFPTAVRYSGSSLAFSLAGVLGASLAPAIATTLASRYGLEAVGWYLSLAAVLALVGAWTVPETADRPL